MGVQITSIWAKRREKRNIQTQERRLYLLLKDSGGISDRQIAERMNLTCALASARRNGVNKKLKEQGIEERVVVLRQEKDPVTKKTVSLWGLAKVDFTKPLF